MSEHQPDDVSRRSAIKHLLGTGAAIPPCASNSLFPSQSARVLALVGDRYHNIDYIRTALGKTIGKDLGLSIAFTAETSALSSSTLKDRGLLIVFRDGLNWPNGYDDDDPPHINGPLVSDPPLPHWRGNPIPWMTTKQGRAVRNFVQTGGGALFYHNAPFISLHNRDFRDVLGAVTEEHPPIRPFKVKILKRDHPITAGVNDFVVTDEQHFVKFEQDPKSIFMESINEQGLAWKDFGVSSPAGWAFDFGRGRVCYLAPGHLLTALWNPEYEKIQRNAVRWLLRHS